jgi:hypothetical protein
MSVIGSNILAGASGQGGVYNLTKSLRFRKSASAYLNRTPASAGNQKTFTFSTWLKRGGISSDHSFFTSGNAAPNPRASFEFTTSDTLYISFNNGSGWVALTTSAVYRDPSAWYHIVVAVDTTQATSTNRVKLYVNGSQVTAFSSATYPNQNDNTSFNDTVPHSIGSYIPSPSQYLDGYLAEVNFVDGQALTPSSFGQTSTSTGVWIPKKYTGTYGTNGFYLPFTDTTSTSTLGTDFSGNSNTWTVNNISLTSGSTYDSMNDVPTLTSATTANYAVMNPLDSGATNSTLSNGNLTVATASTGFRYMGNTIWATSGKFYAEFTLTTTTGYAQVGIAITTTSTNKTLGEDSTSWSYNSWNGTSNNNSSASSFGNSWTTNDVIGIALDKDNNKLYFSKNGTWQNSADPAAGTGSLNIASIAGLATLIGVCDNDNNGSVTFQVNFGQRPFSYTPPTGFVALNTFNLPTPTIGATASTTANKYFDATLYTGNSSTQTVTNSGSMQPDWVWIKDRSAVSQHVLTDSVRGVDRQLFSSLTNAEQTSATAITSFNSNGFTTGANPSPTGATNSSPDAFVAWQWRASNATAVTNTQGSITSTVSANTTAGFSIVTYTGTGANATVGHGLGAVPSMYIVKRRNAGGDNWATYHISTGNTNFLRLDTTNAAQTFNLWQDTTPTSSVFYLTSDVGVNGSGSTFVAYCFAPVAGYSAFGSYTGNGSNDGTFTYTGFRPRFVMIKRTDSTGNWIMFDSAMGTYNVNGSYLYANSSSAEGTSTTIGLDFLSNGFKNRNTYNDSNTSSGTYIYAAFAENPFKYANAR